MLFSESGLEPELPPREHFQAGSSLFVVTPWLSLPHISQTSVEHADKIAFRVLCYGTNEHSDLCGRCYIRTHSPVEIPTAVKSTCLRIHMYLDVH